jgi:hypothetical protein
MASIRPTKNGSKDPRILKTVENALGDSFRPVPAIYIGLANQTA